MSEKQIAIDSELVEKYISKFPHYVEKQGELEGVVNEHSRQILQLHDGKHSHGKEIHLLKNQYAEMFRDIKEIKEILKDFAKYKWIVVTIICTVIFLSSGNFNNLLQFLKGG